VDGMAEERPWFSLEFRRLAYTEPSSVNLLWRCGIVGVVLLSLNSVRTQVTTPIFEPLCSPGHQIRRYGKRDQAATVSVTTAGDILLLKRTLIISA
jgi:hypothetical protein